MDSSSEQQCDVTEAMYGTRPYLQSRPAVEVVIVGGGLAGLLHKAGIPFIILERASSIKPLGINGFDTVVFSRPEFYEVLLSRVPSNKILFGKKVSNIKEASRNNKVEYQGDIPVGANRAYSSVRQCLYRQLEIEGWITFTVPNNRVCWDIQLQLDSAKSKEEFFQTSEWDDDNNSDEMIKEMDDLRTPLGATMGELIRATPQDGLSYLS
ncbi:hypothetical protein KI688_008393 [Linnemannia hyalina]|uniref:FAD-binding domain-containing protein n=1 Tax=Linnemannia hyalina TaxID=64524 RepID=A0A9P7Y298_9FUNG|nr:hypothetical protein KI688_008393 [Linnemannia hyalina]